MPIHHIPKSVQKIIQGWQKCSDLAQRHQTVLSYVLLLCALVSAWLYFWSIEEFNTTIGGLINIVGTLFAEDWFKHGLYASIVIFAIVWLILVMPKRKVEWDKKIRAFSFTSTFMLTIGGTLAISGVVIDSQADVAKEQEEKYEITRMAKIEQLQDDTHRLFKDSDIGNCSIDSLVSRQVFGSERNDEEKLSKLTAKVMACAFKIQYEDTVKRIIREWELGSWELSESQLDSIRSNNAILKPIDLSYDKSNFVGDINEDHERQLKLLNYIKGESKPKAIDISHIEQETNSILSEYINAVEQERKHDEFSAIEQVIFFGMGLNTVAGIYLFLEKLLAFSNYLRRQKSVAI